MQQNSLVFKDGIWSESKVPVQLRPTQGVFETIRARIYQDHKGSHALVLALQLHYSRLLSGCRYFGFSCPELTSIQRIVSEGLRIVSSTLSDYKIRVLVQKEAYSLSVEPWTPDQNFLTGISTVSVRSERLTPEYKHCKITASQTARDFAVAQGHQEAILIDSDNILREGAWSNFVWSPDNSSVWTSKTKVLPGVTLSVLKLLAAEKGLNVVERDCNLEHVLKNIKSACITQATHGVVPIKFIDKTILATDGVFQELKGDYENLFASSEPSSTKLKELIQIFSL